MEKDGLISGCKVLIIGGSAGSLKVLMELLPRLTAFPTFTIVIVLHRKNAEDTTLEELFALKTSFPVNEVEDKTPLEKGAIYVAPSGYHLLFEREELLSLDASEKINYSRPSIDVSFESAAEVYGKGLTAVLLSGANADGTEGLRAIEKTGGTIIIQDPLTAEMPFMPQNALLHTTPDYVVGISELCDLINHINSY
ncbi:chemotaxis protein CheB [Flavobacterium kingsejongi]|uniref:protein-glutamate methylesterase n=1 Tax=Flavobacterium kingsejongi TaxID=1678728 RepID=A0A2S1LRZ2_9FLAO|nr:chemotaxis protein CheB [Flavobacterium kingsejongi]AWG26533.1 chemotaxis protein CheB [Flavobacterium kingsejongi]